MHVGLFSESGTRGLSSAAATYDADLQEIVLADKLGFSEVWIAERSSRSDRVAEDLVTASNLMIAALSKMTTQIKLGTGIRPLPYAHPFSVATEAAMCDQMSGGRYMLGWGGTKGLHGDHWAQMGIMDNEQRSMVYESVEYILKCFTSPEPFDFDGEYWHGKKIRILPRPVQVPHPPIAAACSGSPETLEVAGRHGFLALMGRGSEPAESLAQWAETYLNAAREAGRQGSRAAFRVAYQVYVSDTDEQAMRELREGVVPWLQHRHDTRDSDGLMRFMTPEMTAGQYFDYLVERGTFFVGSPETVHDAIKDYYDRCGGFGGLLMFAGQGWTSAERWEHSCRLISDRIIPRLAELDPDRKAATTAPTS